MENGPVDEDLGRQAFLSAYKRMVDAMSDFFWNAFTMLNINGISGDYVEFGSAGANSLCLAYDVVRQTPVSRHIWAFDSFEGLPDATDTRDAHPVLTAGVRRGGIEQFHAACGQRGVPRNAYTTVAGFYEDTLPHLGTSEAPNDIALAYVDCNMYSSTVSVFEFLEPRLKHGMVVAFDDYFLYSPEHVSGEREALREFLRAHTEWHFHRYKDIHHNGVSFIVEHEDTNGAPRPGTLSPPNPVTQRYDP